MKNDKVAVVPLGERSGGINQVLANDTARRILNLISEEPMSAMHIAYNLDLAINTAQYNLDRLTGVGLAEVVRVEKSRRGRDMKIYGPTNKIIAIVPKGVERGSVMAALKGVLPLFLVALVFAAGVEVILGPQPVREAGDGGIMALTNETPATGEPSEKGFGAAQSEESESAETGPPPREEAPAMVMAAEDAENASQTENRAAESVEAGGGGEIEADEEPGNGEALCPPPPEPETKTIVVTKAPESSLLDHPGLWAALGGLAVIAAAMVLRRRRVLA